MTSGVEDRGTLFLFGSGFETPEIGSDYRKHTKMNNKI